MQLDPVFRCAVTGFTRNSRNHLLPVCRCFRRVMAIDTETLTFQRLEAELISDCLRPGLAVQGVKRVVVLRFLPGGKLGGVAFAAGLSSHDLGGVLASSCWPH